MRAVTIVDGATEIVDMLDYRLAKSVEMSTPCQNCGAKATEFVRVDQYGYGGDPRYGSFRTTRCEEHGAKILLNQPAFKGMNVGVEMLGKREWRTYRDGVLIHESHGQ